MIKLVCLITYDLKAPGRNYENLYAAIEKLCSNPCHALESVWFVKSNFSSQEIYNYLKPHVDENDYIVATEIKNNYFGYAKQEVWDWLKSAFIG